MILTLFSPWLDMQLQFLKSAIRMPALQYIHTLHEHHDEFEYIQLEYVRVSRGMKCVQQ